MWIVRRLRALVHPKPPPAWAPCASAAAGDGAPRVGAPLAPGAGVEEAVAQARRGDGKHVVRRSDARAALVHDLARIPATEQRLELGAQRAAGKEAPVRIEVLRVGAVQ